MLQVIVFLELLFGKFLRIKYLFDFQRHTKIGVGDDCFYLQLFLPVVSIVLFSRKKTWGSDFGFWKRPDFGLLKMTLIGSSQVRSKLKKSGRENTALGFALAEWRERMARSIRSERSEVKHCFK